MTFRRKPENFQELRAKFENTKYKPSSARRLTQSSKTLEESRDSSSKTSVAALEVGRRGDEIESSYGKLKRLSSLTSLSKMSSFSTSPFRRRRDMGKYEKPEECLTPGKILSLGGKLPLSSNGAELSPSAVGCTLFGTSSISTPRESKIRPIPRNNTTGNLHFQESLAPSTSANENFVSSSQKYSSTLSSNSLRRSRIPTSLKSSQYVPLLPKPPSVTNYEYRQHHRLEATGSCYSEPSSSTNIVKIESFNNEEMKGDITLTTADNSSTPPQFAKPLAITAQNTNRQSIENEKRNSPKKAEPVVRKPVPSRRWTAGSTSPLCTHTSSLQKSQPVHVRFAQSFSEHDLKLQDVNEVALKHGRLNKYRISDAEKATNLFLNQKAEEAASRRKITSSESSHEKWAQQHLSKIESYGKVCGEKPSAYWCGRLTAVQDHMRSERDLQGSTILVASQGLSIYSKDSNDTLIHDDSDKAFARLRFMCSNHSAHKSLDVFQHMYTKYKGPTSSNCMLATTRNLGSSNITLDPLSADLAGPSLLSRLKLRKGASNL